MTTISLRLRPSAVLAVALCLPAAQAQACGELMLRTLDTMRYHAFVTRHPAVILLYAGDATGSGSTDDAVRLHDALERSGHTVTLVRGSDALAREVAAHRYDVVISDSDDLVKVSSRLAGSSKDPAQIPLLSQGADERLAHERFPRLVSGGFRDLLKMIEQVMKTTDL